MVKEKDCRQIIHLCDCEDRFIWPRITALNVPVIAPPPIIVSDERIIPKVNRYFYIVTTDIHLTNGVTLAANLFTDDKGDTVTEFSIEHPNGYVNLFINAVMQEGGIYSVSSTSLSLNADNATIYRGTPIIIESIGFFTEVN
ncbi:DUF4183 domain-containing protein [Lysinibacillus sp. FSL W8-0992]|uniref:DUF4183 domain-containing protein n=1 Tax=Lysinibacillus sp. FSL W8-0992 TaxID=2954643 RepID=UPI0030F4EFAC